MIRLIVLRDGTARPVLPRPPDINGWHQAITAALGRHLTSAHAALLAAPGRSATGTAWFALGMTMRRFVELPAADRDKLLHAARSILSDIRRLAESGPDPVVSTAWPALRTIPELNCPFAVDGRPVLAAWGFGPLSGGEGPLASVDDGIHWIPPSPVPWRIYAATLAGIACAALLAGMLLPPLLARFLPAAAARATHRRDSSHCYRKRRARRTAQTNCGLPWHKCRKVRPNARCNARSPEQ